MTRYLLTVSSVIGALIVLSRTAVVYGAIAGLNLKTDFKRVRRNLYKSIHDYIDSSVNPCDDFYHHACGNWGKLHPIPDDTVDYKPIKALSYQTDLLVRDILLNKDEQYAAETKARTYFASCVNQTQRDSLGVRPIIDFMDQLGGWPVLKVNWSEHSFDWVKTIALLRRYGDRILIKESVNYNKKNSSYSIIYLDQPSLGLGNRADYLDSNYYYRLKTYQTYITQVLKVFGVESLKAREAAAEIVNFETELAHILALPHDRANISTFSTDISIDELQDKVRGINWTMYLSLIVDRPMSGSERVVIKEFKYMNNLVELISDNDPQVVANYIFWRFVQNKVSRLSSEFNEPLLQFVGAMLGRKSLPPVWKSCVGDVSYHMREVIGQLFTRYHFDISDREEIMGMIDSIKETFLEIVYNTTWLDTETKDLIKKKLDYMTYQIGYPDIIKSQEKIDELFENLTVSPDRYFDNYLSLLRYSARKKHKRLLLKSEDDQWSNVSPDLYNAYYNPAKNMITIPAGLLQQPLFDQFYTKAFNYGRMGALIGHEMSHAFDNIGRNYDFKGNINSWWNQTVIDLFSSKTECIYQQYAQYRIPNSKHLLDSHGTLSENIADNSGIFAAYKAYRRLVESYGVESEVGENEVLLDDQIFFYSFAQLWCGHTRPEAVLTQTRRDPHSPGMWRVIGTLSNSLEFARTFNCSQETFMNPIKKCRIW